jgi:hypothetical protein
MAQFKKKKKKKAVSNVNKVEQEKQKIIQRFLNRGEIDDQSAIYITSSLLRGDHSEGLKCVIYDKYYEVPAFKAAMRRSFIRNDFSVSRYKALPYKGMSLDCLLCICLSNLSAFRKEVEVTSRLQEEVGKLILNSDWEKANSCLEEIVAISGESLWSISSKFTVNFFSKNFHLSKELTESLPEDIDSISKNQIQYERNRSEEATTPKRYADSLNRQIEDLRLNNLHSTSIFFKLDHYFDPKDDMGDLRGIVGGVLSSRLADQLSYFKRILKIAILNNVNVERTIKNLCKLGINDKELDIVVQNNLCEFTSDTSVTKDVREIFSDYLKDDFEGSFEKSVALINQEANITSIYEICAKSAVIANKTFKSADTLSNKIITKLIEVIKGNRIESNIIELEKYYLNLKQFEFSCHIKAFVEKYSDINKEGAKLVYNYSDMSQVVCSPFNIEYLHNFKDKESSSKIARWFHSFTGLEQLHLEVTDQNSQLPEWRREKVKGDIFLLENNYSAVVEHYQVAINSSNIVHYKEVLPRLIISMFKAGYEEQSLKLLADKLLEYNEVRLLPVEYIAEKLVDDLKRSDDVDNLENIAIILYYYNYHTSSDDVTQPISNVTENLLMVRGIEDVTDIKTEEWAGKLFLLTHIMNVDVIDGFIRLLSDDLDMFTVRMEICQQLMDMKQIEEDQNLYEYVVSEYNSSFNRLINHFCSSSLSNGRIQIEKEQLKVKLINDLKSIYALITENFKSPWYKKFNSVKDKRYDQRFYDLSQIHIIERIKDEYTSNKLFGLDNSLNIRIRHGGLFNFLWAPIKTYKINGIKKENSFKVDNLFEDFALMNDEVITKFKLSFTTFLLEIEKNYLSFKNRCYVNSSQAIKEDERFFHFNYTNPDLLNIVEKIQGGITLPSLIDYIFILLDDQTTYFLQRIRKYRIPELRKSTDAIFTNFIKSISNAPTQLVRQVNLAHQQSLTRCDNLSDWFDWGGEAASDFTVASALEQAYSLVESLHPSANFKKELEDCSTHVFDKNEYSSFVSTLSVRLSVAFKI